MADEITLIVRTHNPIDFTVAEATAIPKGTMAKMTDGRVAIISNGDEDIAAGVCARDKLAGDGRTQHAFFREGIFEGTAGTAGVVFGEPVITDSSTSGSNRLVKAGLNDENIVGIAFATAASGNRFQFELKPTAATLA